MKTIVVRTTRSKTGQNPESSNSVAALIAASAEIPDTAAPAPVQEEDPYYDQNVVGDHDFYTEDITVTIHQNEDGEATVNSPDKGSQDVDPAMEEPIVQHPNCIEYMQSKEELDVKTIEDILKNPYTNLISKMPPVRPKGGSVYVYKLENLVQKRNMRCDQYVWHEQGSTPIPRKEKILKRYYFTIRDEKGPNHGFKKYEHILYSAFGRMLKGRPQELNYPCYCLVQYTGDETVFKPWIHKNSKKSNHPYVRLLASVRDSIEKEYKDTPPSQVYNIMNKYGVGNSKLGATYSPKSISQIHDIQKHIRRKRTNQERQVKNIKMQEEELTLAKETAQQLPGFFLSAVVNKQKNYSSIHLGLMQMLNETNRILQLDKSGEKAPPCLYFHRHYRIGQSYLTLLSFRHPLFEDEPMMPLAFLISQGEFLQGFVEFFRTIANNCEEMNSALFAFITELNVDPVVENEIFTGATRFAPWSTIESTINNWYDTLPERFRAMETIDYFTDISRVLSFKLKFKAKTELESLKTKWSTTFLQYYEEKLSDLVDKSGRWSTEPLNLYDPFLGVKTGFSSHYESIFENLEQWPEIPVNALILCMYNFQQFFLHHVDLAMKGMSDEFVLKKRFMCYKKTPRKSSPNKGATAAAMSNETSVLKPEEIVEIVKESLNLVFQQEENIEYMPCLNSSESITSTPTPSKRPRRNPSQRKDDDDDYFDDDDDD